MKTQLETPFQDPIPYLKLIREADGLNKKGTKKKSV
jgi:hypothetical protein